MTVTPAALKAVMVNKSKAALVVTGNPPIFVVKAFVIVAGLTRPEAASNTRTLSVNWPAPIAFPNPLVMPFTVKPPDVKTLAPV